MGKPLSNRADVFRLGARHFRGRHCSSIELVENQLHRSPIFAERSCRLESLETQIARLPLVVVTRVTIVREKRLNCFLEYRICLGGDLNRTISTLRPAAKCEDSYANERAQPEQSSPEILLHRGFLQ